MCLSLWSGELEALLNSDTEMVYAGITLALVRSKLGLEHFRLQKTRQSRAENLLGLVHNWARFLRAYEFSERHESEGSPGNLWAGWQWCSWSCLFKSPFGQLYKGLVSCRWPTGRVLGAAVSGVASWGIDSSSHTPHWRVGLWPELLT